MLQKIKSKDDYIKKLPEIFRTHFSCSNELPTGYKRLILTLLQMSPDEIRKIVGSPESLFCALRYKVRYVDGMRVSGDFFEYDNEIFQDVESASKKFYQNLGYRCYYTEGFDLPLVNDACISVILNRIRQYLKIGKNLKNREEYINSLDCENSLKKFQATVELCRHFLDCGSPRSALLNFSLLQHVMRSEFDGMNLSGYFDVKVSNSELRKIVKRTVVEIDLGMVKDNKLIFDEIENCIGAHLSEPIDGCALGGDSYWKGLQKRESGISALDIIKTLGFKKCAELTLGDELGRQIYFDLTVIDVKNKKIIKSEVKKFDFFTKSQIFALRNFFWRRSRAFEFELCIARPEARGGL